MRNMTKLIPDINQAKHFLSRLNHDIYTFIYLHQGKPRGFDTWALTEIDWEKLIHLNTQKLTEIFVMVNEGDGVIYPPNKTPRSQKNVIELTSLFIDTDDCPLNEVKSFLKAQRLKPHLLVETSPKKYHLYFLLSPSTQKSKEALTPALQSRWKAIQLKLAHLNTPQAQCDSSTQDSSRVLRLPGFYHLKTLQTPHLTQIAKEYNHSAYSLDEIETKLAESLPHLEAHTLADPLHQAPYSLPQQKVGKGNRHLEITRFLGHLLSQGVTKEIALLSCTQFIQTYIEQPREFLPDGKRHHEITAFIDWKLSQQAHDSDEKRKEAKEAALTLLSSSPENTEDPFQLPDSFYLDAPGLLGQMTKFIYETALYPSAPIAFAASISLLGLLRSKAQIGPRGGTPNNYIMCLAPSGSGKSHAQTILNNTLSALSLGNLLQYGVRSEKGVLRFLENQNGRGLYIFDEGESLFTGFQDSKLPHYLRQVRTLFLELYSSASSSTKILGQTGNEKEKPIVLNYPHLSLLSFGVLHTISEAFTEKTIKDGLLQRFLVVTSTGKRVRNEKATLAKAFPEHILEQLRTIAIKGNQVEEKALLSEQSQPQAKAKRAKVRFSEEAQAAFEAFSDLQDERINETIASGRGHPEIFTRAAEQVERLLVAAYTAPSLGGEAVTYQQYKHMEEFVASRIGALEVIVSKGFKADQSKYGNDYELYEQVRDILAKRQAETGLGLSMKVLWDSVTPRPSYRAFQSIISAGIDMGVFEKKKVIKGRGQPAIVISIA